MQISRASWRGLRRPVDLEGAADLGEVTLCHVLLAKGCRFQKEVPQPGTKWHWQQLICQAWENGQRTTTLLRACHVCGQQYSVLISMWFFPCDNSCDLRRNSSNSKAVCYFLSRVGSTVVGSKLRIRYGSSAALPNLLHLQGEMIVVSNVAIVM